MFEGLNILDFQKKFVDNESCYRYLMEFKWGNDFVCRRCKSNRWVLGRTYYYRRCQECKYDESVTSHTLFHDMKIPILKAFHLLFRLSTKKKGMSSVELASETNVQQRTAWLFKSKIQLAMKKAHKRKLTREVVIDETLIGGSVQGSYGRKHDHKQIAVVAIEQLADGRTGNIEMRHVSDFTYKCIAPAIEDMVDKKARLYADDFPTYRAVKAKRTKTKLIRSKESDFFDEMHKQIMIFKMWLTGIHHKCSKEHLFKYQAEYTFRFNRRNQRKWIFQNLIRTAYSTEPCPYLATIRLCERNT